MGSWKTLYIALSSVEKVLPHVPIEDAKSAGSFWSQIVVLLRHSHPWICQSSLRLLAGHLALFATGAQSVEEDALIGTREAMHHVMHNVVSLLHRRVLGEELFERLLEALVLLGSLIYAHPFIRVPGGEGGEGREGGEGGKRGTGGDGGQHKSDLLLSLFERLSHTFRRKQLGSDEVVFMKKATILRWMKEMLAIVAPLELPPLLLSVLFPIYLLLEAKPRRRRDRELQQLAQELLDAVQAAVSPEVFGEAYGAVRDQIRQKRSLRVQERLQLKVSNPELAREQKLQRRSRVAKKRRSRFDRLRANRPTIKTREYVPGNKSYDQTNW